MNINAYDTFEYNIEYWIWTLKKKMYFKNIKFRKYYSFLCRYDNSIGTYDLYVLITDNKTSINNAKVFLTIGVAVFIVEFIQYFILNYVFLYFGPIVVLHL